MDNQSLQETQTIRKNMSSPMQGSSSASMKTPKASSSSKTINPRRIKQQQPQLSSPEPPERNEELPGKHFNKFSSTIVPNPMMMTTMSRTGMNEKNLFLNQPTRVFSREQTAFLLSSSNKHQLLSNSDHMSTEKQPKSRFSALNSKRSKPKSRSEKEKIQTNAQITNKSKESFQYNETTSASDDEVDKRFKYRKDKKSLNREKECNAYDGQCRTVQLSESSFESTSSDNELHNYTTSDSCSSSSDSNNDSDNSDSSDNEEPMKLETTNNCDKLQNYWPGLNGQIGLLSAKAAPRLSAPNPKSTIAFIGSSMSNNDSWGFAAEAKKNIDIFRQTSEQAMTKSINKASAVIAKKANQSVKQKKDTVKMLSDNLSEYFSPNDYVRTAEKKYGLQSTVDPRSNEKLLKDSKSACGNYDQTLTVKRKHTESSTKHDNKKESETCSKSTILSRCFSSIRSNQQVAKDNYNLYMSTIGEEGMSEKLSPSKLVKKAINEKHFERQHKSRYGNNDPQMVKMYNTDNRNSCSSLSSSSSVLPKQAAICNSIASNTSAYYAVPAGKADTSGALHHLPPHSKSPSIMGKKI